MYRRVYASAAGVQWTIVATVFLVGALLSGGCAELRETYYVGVIEEKTDTLQFYRFRLTGRSILSRTQYVSGWYPAAAIDALVGEEMDDILDRKPDPPDKPAPGGNPSTAPTDSGSKKYVYWVTGPQGRRDRSKDKRLAIIMSSDPSAITKAIGALADSKAVEAFLAELATKRAKDAKDSQDRQNDVLKELLLEKGVNPDIVDALFGGKN